MSTAVIISAVAAQNVARQEQKNQLSAKHLATMNNQPCEYQISVNDGYKCMTQQEYDAYQALPASTGEKIGGTIIGVLVIVLAIAFLHGMYLVIFD